MFRQLLPTLALVVLAASPALADAKKSDAKALKGTWEREANNVKISFEFKDEKTFRCTVTPEGATEGATVDCEYKLGKDGIMTFTVTDGDKKGTDATLPSKGAKFSFKVEAGKEKMTISDFVGVDDDSKQHAEAAKGIVHGEYSKKK